MKEENEKERIDKSLKLMKTDMREVDDLNEYNEAVRFLNDRGYSFIELMRPNRLYDTKNHYSTKKNDVKFTEKFLRKNGPQTWDNSKDIVYYKTCKRCGWRFAWKAQVLYCSTKCRYEVNLKW